MTTELTTVARHLHSADSYLDVFGSNGGSDTDTLARQIKHTYRHLARVLHPDQYQDPAQLAVANQAFARLGDLHKDAKTALKAGNYGQPGILATMQTHKGEHQLTKLLVSDDICDVYASFSVMSGVKHRTITKVAGNAQDNDLVQTEASALKRLRASGSDPTWHAYFPELLDSFSVREAGQPERQANVLNRLEGFYSLAQVRSAFQHGLDPLHVAWMWRRLLVALGHAHDQGVIHGAVLPPHVLILPEQHGLVLTDWCYASLRQDDVYLALKALVPAYQQWYPSEVTDRQLLTPSCDIMLAARTMIYLLGGDPLTGRLPVTVPAALRAFFGGCLLAAPQSRPDNAWNLLAEFDRLLERMGSPYFPRRFRAFTMPHGMA